MAPAQDRDGRREFLTSSRRPSFASPVRRAGDLSGATATLRLYADPDSKMHKQAGMRQNRRAAVAVAKAEQGSQSVRTDAKRLSMAAAGFPANHTVPVWRNW